jgi:hypothetical protein
MKMIMSASGLTNEKAEYGHIDLSSALHPARRKAESHHRRVSVNTKRINDVVLDGPGLTFELAAENLVNRVAFSSREVCRRFRLIHPIAQESIGYFWRENTSVATTRQNHAEFTDEILSPNTSTSYTGLIFSDIALDRSLTAT